MRTESILGRLALGAVAGFAGTVALQAIRTANQKWIPEGSPPMLADPAEVMVDKAKAALPAAARQWLPSQAEVVAQKLLPLGYGMTFGALYATARPAAKRALTDGLLLGVVCWAVGWLGWLPKLGLMPPVWRHRPKQIARPVAEHAIFGLATAAGYRWLKEHASH